MSIDSEADQQTPETSTDSDNTRKAPRQSRQKSVKPQPNRIMIFNKEE